jgi:hypothetical protein
MLEKVIEISNKLIGITLLIIESTLHKMFRITNRFNNWEFNAMRKSHIFLTVLFVALLGNTLVTPVLAQESEPMLDKNMLSIGAGISQNSVGRADEIGFQLFAAYDLNQVNVMEGVNSSVEFGLMDYGFSRDSTGIWGTYVIAGPLSEQVGWVARAGFDIGDDSGLMFGAGAEFALDEKRQLRLEYVVRDDVDSLQLNFLYHL